MKGPGFVLALLWLNCAGLAQQPPIIRAETRTVLVEAVVTGKKGEFVQNLGAKDFRIWQDGKEQVVTSLSSETNSKEPHFLVLFFDDTKMGPADRFRARQAVSRFIDANSAPNRLMAAVSFEESLRVAQNFTDNAGKLKEAIARVETASQGQGSGTDSSGNGSSRNMLQALANLAKGLGVLPGRKSVVLLTGGIPSSSDMKSKIAAVIDGSSRSGVAVYPVDVEPVSVSVDQSKDPFKPRTEETGGRRTRSGIDDSSPLSQDPAASSQPLLLTLANGTGGFLIPNSGDLLAGLQRIAEEQTAYYVLSYTPPESKEGSCHELRVKVDRGGATVRARSRYCATKPLDLVPESAAARELESGAASADAGDLTASIQLPYFYASPGIAKVHLAVELALHALKFENQKGKFHAELNLLGIAAAPDGNVGARFSDTLKFDFETQAEIDKWKLTPLHYEKEFKIAPGAYNLTVMLGQAEGNFGKIEAPLVVDPWNGMELALSSIALSRETHPAGDIGLVSSLMADQTPLVAEGAQFVPSGSNEFAKSAAGFFYLEVYDPNPSQVTLRVRVLDRKTGEERWDSGVTKPPASTPGKFSIPAGANLPLNSLAAGSYELDVTASDGTGKQVQRTVDFDVK